MKDSFYPSIWITFSFYQHLFLNDFGHSLCRSAQILSFPHWKLQNIVERKEELPVMCAGLLQGSHQLCRFWNTLLCPQLFDSWAIWFMRTAKIQLLISHKLSIQSFHPMPGYEELWWTEGTKDGVLWPWNELGFSKRNQKERNNKRSSARGRGWTLDSWNWTVISRQEQEHFVQIQWSSQSSDYLSVRPWLLIMCCGRGRYGWKEIALFAAS